MIHITRFRAAGCWSAALIILIFFTGCNPPHPPLTVPIKTIRYEAPEGPHRRLFVFLPGYGDQPSAFERHGLVQMVKDRMPDVDMIAVNAHIGYYLNGSLFLRLKEDVIDPARARGYQSIWLIGNSLGGFGSISYARMYPVGITGIVLLGPFLGERSTVNEILKAGSLEKWSPGVVGNNSKEDLEKQLWLWIKSRQQQKDFRLWLKDCEEEPGCLPKVYLGYGENDRFSFGQKLLAANLPLEHVVVIQGGHNWSTWFKAWDIILEKMARKKQEIRGDAVIPGAALEHANLTAFRTLPFKALLDSPFASP